MKKKIFVLSLLLMIGVLSTTAWAAKEEKEFGVHARTKYGVKDVVEGTVDEKTGEHVVMLEDGKLQIRVNGIIDEAARLMVMPIRKDKKEIWAWLQSITKEIGENKSAYDIFFVDEKGDRIEVGEGSQVSVISNVRTQKVAVYYITDAGEHNPLKAIIEEYVVKFNMIRNGYYTLLVQNGKDQIGKDFEKGDEQIGPKDEEKEDEDKQDEEKEDEDDFSYDETENESDDVGAGQYGTTPEGDSKKDAMWLIVMFVIVAVTIILFIIIFAKKKKNKDNEEKPKKEKKSKKEKKKGKQKEEDIIPEIDLDIISEMRKDMPVDMPVELPKNDGVEEVSVEDHFKKE